MYSPQRAGQRTSQNGFGVRKILHRSSGPINTTELSNSTYFRDESNGTVPGFGNRQKTWSCQSSKKRGFYRSEVAIVAGMAQAVSEKS